MCFFYVFSLCIYLLYCVVITYAFHNNTCRMYSTTLKYSCKYISAMKWYENKWMLMKETGSCLFFRCVSYYKVSQLNLEKITRNRTKVKKKEGMNRRKMWLLLWMNLTAWKKDLNRSTEKHHQNFPLWPPFSICMLCNNILLISYMPCGIMEVIAYFPVLILWTNSSLKRCYQLGCQLSLAVSHPRSRRVSKLVWENNINMDIEGETAFIYVF